MLLTRSRLLLIIFCLALLINGCTTRIRTYPSLANRGVLPLSTDNPYLGSNRFLAEEAELSGVLLNFLELQGAPTALEIIEKQLRPPKLLLYYAKQMQVYAAQPRIRESGVKEWVVSGPYSVNRRDYKDIKRLAETTIGQPVFIVYGERRIFKEERRVVATNILRPKIPPPPSPKPVPRKKKPQDKAPAEPTHTQPVQSVSKPGNLDQQAIAISQGYAERTSGGDLIHTVKHENETLKAIAKWYTDAESKADDLAKLNNLASTDAVPQGTRIVIPEKDLKKFKVMPPDFK